MLLVYTYDSADASNYVRFGTYDNVNYNTITFFWFSCLLSCTYDNVFGSLVFDVSAPEGHDSVLAAGDEGPVRGVGDLEHGLPVRHVLNAGWKVEGDLQHGYIPAVNNMISV